MAGRLDFWGREGKGGDNFWAAVVAVTDAAVVVVSEVEVARSAEAFSSSPLDGVIVASEESVAATVVLFLASFTLD